MSRAGRKCQKLGAAKERMDHGNVIQVAGADPWVIRDNGVARAKSSGGKALQHRLEGPRQSAHEARNAALRLRQLPAPGIE